MEQVELHTPAGLAAGARSRLYQLLAAGFAFPEEDLHAAARDGTYAQAIAEVLPALPYGIDASDLERLRTDLDYTTFQSEYIRLFDVGAPAPPCPLYGGVWAGDRMKVMEDALRFYHFFDLRLSPELRELPDHITTELEFLHYLTFCEAEAREHGEDPGSWVRAERDFLARHPCKWVPRMARKLAAQDPPAFYAGLVSLATRVFNADRAYAAAAAD